MESDSRQYLNEYYLRVTYPGTPSLAVSLLKVKLLLKTLMARCHKVTFITKATCFRCMWSGSIFERLFTTLLSSLLLLLPNQALSNLPGRSDLVWQQFIDLLEVLRAKFWAIIRFLNKQDWDASPKKKREIVNFRRDSQERWTNRRIMLDSFYISVSEVSRNGIYRILTEKNEIPEGKGRMNYVK